MSYLQKFKCSYLGCKCLTMHKENVITAPGKLSKKHVCKKHRGQLSKNISLKATK